MANGFKFSLEKLLEMRKTREEEGKKLFNNSQQELQKSINKWNDLIDKYKQYNGIAAGEPVIYKKLMKREIKSILLVSTGAFMSTTSSLQGESIPGIAHAVAIEF